MHVLFLQLRPEVNMHICVENNVKPNYEPIRNADIIPLIDTYGGLIYGRMLCCYKFVKDIPNVIRNLTFEARQNPGIRGSKMTPYC